MTEKPETLQGIDASSETPIPSTGEGNLQIGNINQLRHFHSVKYPTEVNLDADTMDSTSGEKHYVPSRSSCLISE